MKTLSQPTKPRPNRHTAIQRGSRNSHAVLSPSNRFIAFGDILQLLVAVGLILVLPTAGQTQAQTTYTWNGKTSSVFTDKSNWTDESVAATDMTANARINVYNGGNNPLIYTAAQGTTIYEANGTAGNRALFIASGASGSAMIIQGGTFDSRGGGADGMSLSGDGSLTIDGGHYINTNGGSSAFIVKYDGTGTTGTLTVNSGSFTAGTLQLGNDADSKGNGVINLNGGALTYSAIRKGTNGTSLVNSTFNFNGGTLVAGASSTTFMQGLDTANVLAGGAIIDTNNFNITIAQALLDGSGGGGLTKTGSGTLTLSGVNTYAGVTTIAQGTLKLGNESALGTTGGKTVIQSGATLDIAGLRAGTATPGDELIEVSGSGVNGLGALYNSGGTQTQAFRNVTLLGDTTFGGTGRWDLRNGTLAVGGHTITKVGTNTVSIVSATVTNPGDVNVNAGVFRFEGSTNYNAATPVTISVAGGARLDYWATTIAHNPNIVLNGGTVSVNSNSTPSFSGTITLNAGSNIIGVGNEYGSPTLTISGQITGAGGFTLNGRNTSGTGGNGILILANTTNDYSGTTTISTGTLKLGAAGVIPDGSGKGNMILNAGTVAAGTFDLNGFSETINGLQGSSGDVLGQVVNNAVGTTSTLTVGNGDATTVFAGLLRDNTGTGGVLALAKTGTGTLTLSGTNTYSGATNVNAGVLRIENASALGGTVAGTTVASGARIELADELPGGITVSDESLTISGSGGNNRGALQTQSGVNTWAGNVTLGANETRIGAVGAGNSLTVSGAIGDGGTNRTLAIRNDGGTTILSGENTYGGNTDVVIGLLKIDGGDNRLPTGTVLRMGYTEGSDVSTFDLNGWNQQVAGLLARATTTKTTVTNSSATPSILTVNNTSSYTYEGLVTGNLALTKAGTGTLVLSGENTYTGAASISKGIVRITNASALGDAGSGTTVLSGAQLELAGGIVVSGESLTISGSGTNNVGALQSQSGSNTWAGDITLGANGTRIGTSGAGQTLTISGNIGDGGNNYTLAVRNAAATGPTILTGGNNTYGGETHVVVGTLQIDGGDNRLPTGTVLRIGNSSNVSSATFDLNGYNQQVAGLTSDGSTMTRTVTNTAGAPSTFAVNNASNFTYSGVVSGNLALTKTGVGRLTLAGDNTYTGLTTVNTGTLLVTGSLANNGSSHVHVASAGTAFGSSDPTIVRQVAGGGSFAGLGSQITGSGTLGTQADMVAGSNGSGNSLDVAMAWRTFDSAETAAFPALTNPLSDIVQLTGMGTGETDPFVLQMSYSSSLVQPYHDGLFLAWLSPSDDWVNAVEGNFGLGASAVADATGSWDSIVDAGDLASYLGSWGMDSSSGTAWAVLNHNSQFAVLAVPEPSSLLLGGMGLIGMLLAVRRRRS